MIIELKEQRTSSSAHCRHLVIAFLFFYLLMLETSLRLKEACDSPTESKSIEDVCDLYNMAVDFKL
jgi:hypothetical protein